MNKQQVKGRYEEAKGKMKEVVGHITGNDDLEAEGKLQKDAGKVQAGVGDVEAEIKQDS
ncbi:MAG: CsbD family protein [Candidatus Competibacteraceae bacterium]|uniref:CsbD family protein n=1 Tax=Candidatus Contendobacter odensis Run_B_J11 TaxID=1400861 RepID=A0A7U7GCD3_9GAMM|nr:CsbD family protein [Candidatus Contendobacter odensis]MBK8535471.1 CsbD family protein [Candidatus Competibacteraceae bacterium]MBK8752645.1 CsbD family protein [Candidatus Competibacteraceae bacterium]CDH45190.1 CsbD family protein [Candidatus Contendobacter odensis Run_B_J11]